MALLVELIRVAFCFPLTLVLFGFWAWILISTARKNANRNCRFLLGCFTTFISPFGLLLFSVMFANFGSEALATLVPLAAFGFHVALSTYLVKLWPTAISAIIASAVMSGYMLLAAAFVSVQAIQGDWL